MVFLCLVIRLKVMKNFKNIPFDDLQVTVVDVPFGVIPTELDQVYPLAQNESPSFDENSLQMVNNVVQKYLKDFKTAFISADVVETFQLQKNYQLKEVHEIPEP